MTKCRSADAAEVFALEHRFPALQRSSGCSWPRNVGSAVLMLLAQA